MDKKRLIWGCRRGMLELDLILNPFVEEVYPTVDEKVQAQFEALLSSADQDLYDWLTGRSLPEKESLKDIVLRVRDHAQAKS